MTKEQRIGEPCVVCGGETMFDPYSHAVVCLDCGKITELQIDCYPERKGDDDQR